MLPDNIKPVHCSLQALGTGTTFTSMASAGGLRSFYNLSTLGSSTTFTSLKISGYQYTFARPTSTASSTDAEGTIDRWKKIIYKTFHEGAGTLDLWDRDPNPPQEPEGTLDRFKRIVIKTFHEGSGSSDANTDRARAQVNHFTTKLIGKVVETDYFTTRMTGKTLFSGNFTTYMSGQVNSLTAATSTGGSNPFDPSVAIGGTTIIGPTAPPAAQTVYISIPNTGISTHPSWDGLFKYGVSLDYGGGSFSVGSDTPIGANGQQITLFGLNAIITRGGGANGFEYSSTLKGYNASGIFGSAKLNRQINLAVGGSVIASPIVLNPSLISAPANTWLTAKAIASLIANICGVTLHWAANDVSVKDFSLEPGMKGIDVLQSMSQRVGATLRWFGNNNYYVAYPNQTVGSFTVPNQNLITPAGISMEPILDLDTGVSGGVNQGMYVVPQISTTSSTTVGSTGVPNPSAGSNNPTVVQVAKVGKLLTDDDPPMIFDLPYNYDQVYVQILIAAGQSTSGANGLGIQNFVTTDPQQVFLLSDTGFANNLIFNTLVGNAYIPQVKIDSRIMPENAAVQAGNFTLTVFCTLKDLNGAYDAAVDEANNAGSSVQQRNPLFVKTHQGKINCYFFGVMPLPGMQGSATVDDKTVSGIIENVTFTPPGILSIDVAQYARLNFTQPIINIGTNS